MRQVRFALTGRDTPFQQLIMFSCMDDDTLATFPYVKVRLACRKCRREAATNSRVWL